MARDPKAPNLQNIPIRSELGRKIRKAYFGPRAGCAFIVVDYSWMEMRMHAEMLIKGTKKHGR